MLENLQSLIVWLCFQYARQYSADVYIKVDGFNLTLNLLHLRNTEMNIAILLGSLVYLTIKIGSIL